MTYLRKLRENQGKTLDEVAEAIHYDPGNLSRLERGQRRPSYTVACSLADYYKVSIDVIFGRASIPTPEVK